MNKLYEYRQMKHLSQSELARKSGLSRQTVIMVEQGKQSPTSVTAKKIADALGSTIEQIFFADDVNTGVRDAKNIIPAQREEAVKSIQKRTGW